ncbi:ATP-dependent helicase Lhr and Lhr-like helicase [Bosea sp. OK403]|uniref:DEAD/DEAH box helicase n=1 Tax=Bosea sp. OK403 TaxID=1855286 RepID=UPI0008E61C98|nr:DEAD/DEAH box helicase [Bosea sp. OK403]SFJ74709.1 ATP-dependent helicase Lhr and Lhr-like helicase [Bosea sp. OK403]
MDAYDRLDPQIRRWIREQGWAGLRDIQADAIGAIMEGDGDVVISAATAAGKTEAAFLPILTLVNGRKPAGLSVLYVGPLKALINDQFKRLDELCERMEVPVVRWHGDAPQSAKSRTLKQPSGIALITPESIEAMLIRRPSDAVRLLSELDFIVVDELHYFMAGARGLHLASLLKRIDAMATRPVRRVGLSATIGDLDAARAWLRPGAPERVTLVESRGRSGELQLQIRGYVDHGDPPSEDPDGDEVHGEGPVEGEGAEEADDEQVARPMPPPPVNARIADHLFATLRGQNNLVFAPARNLVETLADGLRSRSEDAGLPNEFFPHHGSLSKDLREPLEIRLKEEHLPTTAVCTSTLELGIDIGSIASVAQIGAPRSIAALRQRLGRTGRREGSPSVLRIYVSEAAIEDTTSMLDRLRPGIVRGVAAIRLLAKRFVEPPAASAELATGLLHQTLSIIAEKGGARADAIFRTLSGPGPFASVTSADFVALVRHVASKEVRLVEQASDGTLMLGERGEPLVQAKEFYALFESGPEWKLVVGAKPLGTIPLTNVVAVGNLVVFAGRRWQIEGVDERRKVLQVVPHKGGRVPMFDRRQSEASHDVLVAEMREVYRSDDIPAFLDATAKELLAEGRQAYRLLKLDVVSTGSDGSDLNLFLWRGTEFSAVFAVVLAMVGLNAEPHDFGVTIADATEARLDAALAKLRSLPMAEWDRLPDFITNIQAGKFDEDVPIELLKRFWLRRNKALIDDVRTSLRSWTSHGRG